MDELCFGCFQPKTGSGPCQNCGFDLSAELEKFPLALQPGSVLNGRYLSGRVLEQDDISITYLAFDLHAKEKVTIKEYLPVAFAARTDHRAVVPVSAQKQEEFLYGKERFLTETKVLAQFSGNPDMVCIRSSFKEYGTAYYVMDCVEERNQQGSTCGCGEELAQTVKNARPVTEKKKRNAVMIGAAAAMIAAAILIPIGIRSEHRKAEQAAAEKLMAEQIAAEEPPAERMEEQTVKQTAEEPEAEQYAEAEALENEGRLPRTAMAFYAIKDYKDAYERSIALWDQIAVRNTIVNEPRFRAGLRTDGTVITQGYNQYGQCDVADWTDIIAIAADWNHTVGLRSDGTVVEAGSNEYGQCDVSEWTDIVAVYAYEGATMGIRADGALLSTASRPGLIL